MGKKKNCGRTSEEQAIRRMKKYRCPNCKSTAIWQHISIVAKMNLNGMKIYDVQKWNIDNCFEKDCGCKKCGWQGEMAELL